MALAWTWAAGRAVGQELPAGVAVGLFLFVWSIYLADRLIDVARCPDWGAVPERLRFGRRYRTWFRGALWMSLAGTAWLAVGLPGEILLRVAITAPGVLIYFALFVQPVFGRKLLGKEFAIGFFCTLPIWVAYGWLREFSVLLPFYAGLISCNCLVIASREQDLDRRVDPGAATAWWPSLDRDVTRLLLVLLALLAAMALARSLPGYDDGTRVFLGAQGISAVALLVLHTRAMQLSAERVRSLADLCLLVPVLLFSQPGQPSTKHLRNHACWFDTGKAEVQPLAAEGEALVVNSE